MTQERKKIKIVEQIKIGNLVKFIDREAEMWHGFFGVGVVYEMYESVNGTIKIVCYWPQYKGFPKIWKSDLDQVEKVLM